MKQIVKMLSVVFLLILAAGCGGSSSNSTPTSGGEDDFPESKTEIPNINEIKTFFGDEFEILSKDCGEVAGTPEGDTRRVFNNPVVGFVKDVGGCKGCIDHLIYALYLNEKTGIKYVEIKYSVPIFNNEHYASIKMHNPEWKFKDGKLYVNESDSDYGFYMYKEADGVYLYSKIMDKALKLNPSHYHLIPAELPYCGI